MDLSEATRLNMLEARVVANERRLERFDKAFFGEDGRGGLAADVSRLATHVRALLWVGGIATSAVVTAVVLMVLQGGYIVIPG